MSLNLTREWQGRAGTRFGELVLGKTTLGQVEIVASGFLTSQFGKPVLNLHLAAKQIIDRKLSAAEKEAATWRGVMSELKRDAK